MLCQTNAMALSLSSNGGTVDRTHAFTLTDEGKPGLLGIRLPAKKQGSEDPNPEDLLYVACKDLLNSDVLWYLAACFHTAIM